MNPLTNVKNIKKLSEQELKLGGKSSWHDQYRDSAWIFVGGLPYDLTEGDILSVFSQYGEIVHINLVRDKETGKQKGFCFICYEDQRSTILAVDNLNSIKILGRTLRVDHVENYKAPKESKKNPFDDETRLLQEQGCAPVPTKVPEIKMEPIEVLDDIKLPPRLPIGSIKKEEDKKSKKKDKKEKKSKKNKKEKKQKRKRKHSTDSDSSDSSSDSEPRRKKSKKDKKEKKKRRRSSSSSSDD